MFYILCDLINSCSNLYRLKPNELEEALVEKKTKYWEIDFDSLNLKKSVKVSMKAFEPKKRSEPKKTVVASASSEVDFIRSFLYNCFFNQTIQFVINDEGPDTSAAFFNSWIDFYS